MGLDVQFGAPAMEIREPRRSDARSARVRALFARRSVHLRGTHWLLVSPKCWRLSLADGLSVRDSSSTRQLDMAMARFAGEQLDGLAISVRTGATTFYFDLGAQLAVRSPTRGAHDSELWSLNNRRHVVCVGAGGVYSFGSVKQSPDPSTPLSVHDSGVLVVARTAFLKRRILGMFPQAAV